jgi:hypothetical protein
MPVGTVDAYILKLNFSAALCSGAVISFPFVFDCSRQGGPRPTEWPRQEAHTDHWKIRVFLYVAHSGGAARHFPANYMPFAGAEIFVRAHACVRAENFLVIF